MVRVAESALRAEPHGQPPDSEQWPAPTRLDSGGWISIRGRRTGGTSDTPGGSVKPAELAQARLFKSTLQNELARLNELASRLGGRSGQLRAPESSQEQSELKQIHACIAEVRRLLEGLQRRFGTAD